MLTQKTFDDINTLRATYYDPSYVYKQHVNSYEQGYNFNTVDGFSNSVDAVINNYSVLALTNLKRIQDIFEIEKLDLTYISIPTYLSFNVGGGDVKYLCFKEPITDYTIESAYEYDILAGKDIYKDIIQYFICEFINDYYCAISYTYRNKKYYLHYDFDEESFYFVRDTEGGTVGNQKWPPVYNYILNENGSLSLSITKDTGSVVTHYNVMYRDDINELVLSQVLSNTTHLLEDTSTRITLNFSRNTLTNKRLQTTIKYSAVDLHRSFIDSDQSEENAEQNFLLSFQYTDVLDNTVKVNALALQNNTTDSGETTWNSGLQILSDSSPAPYVKTYHKLETGTFQEGGAENISIIYNFYDKPYVFQQGTTTFTTASSLFPYEQLNINNTAFVSDGAFAGPSPDLSDRVYYQRRNDTAFNTGTYLCTWLSGNSFSSDGVWVDRYYYPDKFTREQALSAYSAFNDTFNILENVVDSLSAPFVVNANTRTVVDLQSDLVFKPNNIYQYYRLQDSQIASALSKYTNYINTKRYNTMTVKNVVADTSQPAINFSGDKYYISNMPSDLYREGYTLQFGINTSLWSNAYAPNIIGNINEDGISVYKTIEFTPFIIIPNKNVVSIYNSNKVLLSNIVLPEVESVVDIIRFTNTEPFFIVTNKQIHKYDISGQNIVSVPMYGGYIHGTADEKYIYILVNQQGDYKKYTKSLKYLLTGRVISHTADQEINTIVASNGDVIGYTGDIVKQYDDTSVIFLKNNTVIAKEYISAEHTDVMFITENGFINDFALDVNNNLCILHSNSSFAVYDKYRREVFTVDIPGIGVDVDVIREYVDGKWQQRYVVLYNNGASSFMRIYTINGGLVSSTVLGGELQEQNKLLGVRLPIHYNTTNFNTVNTNKDDDLKIRFRVTDANEGKITLVDELVRIPITDVETVGTSKYTCQFEPRTKTFRVFRNMYLIHTSTYTTNKINSFIKSSYVTPMYIGAIPIPNNIGFDTLIQHPGYGYMTNILLSDITLYNTGKYELLLILPAANKPIPKLYTHLPCGQTNNIEEISQFFKYGNHPYKSSTIGINVKNSNITDTALQSNITSLLRNTAEKYLPIDVSIDNVQFIDYE